MQIKQPPPAPLPFIKRAEAHLAKELEAWKAVWRGTPAEQFVLEYAVREGWVMPGVETFEHVTVLSLYPNCSITDLKELDRQIKASEITEAEATKIVVRNARSDAGEVEAGINRIRYGEGSILARKPIPEQVQELAAAKRTVVAAPEPPATPPVLFRSDFVPQPVGAKGKATGGTDAPVAPHPTPPAKTPPGETGEAQQVLVGKPEALGTTSRREHGVCFGGVYCYTFDIQLAETLKAGQVQGVTFEAEVEQGDFGLKIKALRLTNQTI